MRAAFFLANLLVAAFFIADPAWAGANAAADSPQELAMALAKRASRAEKAGEVAQAYIFYSEASALQPRNRRYKGKMLALQTRAALQSKPRPDTPPAAAEAEFPDTNPDSPLPPELTPEDVFDSMTEREMAQARELRSVPALRAKPGKQDFNLTGDPRELFDRIAERFGLQTVFDGDYPPGGERISFRVNAVDYGEALHDLEAATSSFVIPLSAHIFMVAKDTTQKRNDLEQTMAIAVPVPQAISPQDLAELAPLVRQAFNVEKIAWDTAQSRIIMRDRVSRVVPAVALLQELMQNRPEVMIDLEFLQVDASDIVNYGFTVTNSFSAAYLGQILNNVIATPAGATNLLTFGAGRTLIGLTVAQAQAMFNQTKGSSKSLYHAQIRSVVGQAATLKIGEKYPVVTSGFTGNVSPAQQGQTFVPPPAFTFEDLGFTIKVTPYVHGMGDVTMNLETSFEVLAGSAINNIPVIGRRNLASQVRLRNGEWAMVGGLMNNTRSKSTTGFWGLANIPFFGYLFKQVSTDDEDSNVLIGLRPRLLSLPPDQVVTHALRVGSETRPYTPL